MKINGKVRGKNILYRADCKAAMQKLIELDIYVDLIYLDPPFNNNREYNVICEREGRGISSTKSV